MDDRWIPPQQERNISEIRNNCSGFGESFFFKKNMKVMSEPTITSTYVSYVHGTPRNAEAQHLKYGAGKWSTLPERNEICDDVQI